MFNVVSTNNLIIAQGLVSAIQDLLPTVEHRFCMRHLYVNFRKRFSGQILKILMWKAARSIHPTVWERMMLIIKELNIDTYKYLIVIPPMYIYCTNTRFLYKYLISIMTLLFRFWSKSRFSENMNTFKQQMIVVFINLTCQLKATT